MTFQNRQGHLRSIQTPSHIISSLSSSMRRRRPRRHTFQPHGSMSLMAMYYCFGLLTLLTTTTTTMVDAANRNPHEVNYLSEDSVVLITGAAGFLGSQLALALSRTFGCRNIIGVDRLLLSSSMDAGQSSTAAAAAATTTASTTNNAPFPHRNSVNDKQQQQQQAESDLGLFEFQRQRVFTVWQTLGETATFYRTDFRPMIPDYFDMGELPILDHIFREHTDITHIVHLADPFPHSALQAVPREKDIPKAGMMEALLEQIKMVEQRTGKAPHFVYASSSDVYPKNDVDDDVPLEEDQTLSTPRSLRGASKLLDEILAKLYADTDSIFSIGLRFFSIYGPWSVPGSPLFEMAERAVSGHLNPSEYDESIHDFVYIDDAIDAIMSAMQVSPTQYKKQPMVLNVASGKGASWREVSEIMMDFFPNNQSNQKNKLMEDKDFEAGTLEVSVGSTERAERVLGFQPQFTLKEGIIKLLAWHWDRAYPYGGTPEDFHPKSEDIVSEGLVSCLPTDTECLQAAPVFPCASECSHISQCTKSYWDDILGWTQSLTQLCTTVVYTVALDPDLADIPSAAAHADSFVETGTCNLAFVTSASPLVQKLRGTANGSKVSPTLPLSTDRTQPLRTGKWMLIPVQPLDSKEDPLLSLLPKLSPGLFFDVGVEKAVYLDPDMYIESLPRLLKEAAMQPHHPQVDGATALLIGKQPLQQNSIYDDFVPQQQIWEPLTSRIQKAAYRMVRIAVADDKFLGGFGHMWLDARWMVHTLQSDDARLFRCDASGEVLQWAVDSDRPALEFVLGLHDKWSRVMASKPWWVGENVLTVAEVKGMSNLGASHRRLEEVSTDDTEASDKEQKEETAPDEDDVVETVPESELIDEEEVQATFDIERDDFSVRDDDKTDFDEEEAEDDVSFQVNEIDNGWSSYDTWMGILSATSRKYFVRIVPSSEVGIMSISS